MPKDPVERAQVRFFVDAASDKLLPLLFHFWFDGGSADGLLIALENIQLLLTPDAKVAVGKSFTIADAVLAPMLRRLEIIAKHNIAPTQKGEAKRVFDKYQGEDFVKLRQYFEAIKARESFQGLRDEVSPTAYRSSHDNSSSVRLS